jgi:DNA-binding transcriptional ArsR family regulator
MLTGAQRSELSDRILSALVERGRGVKASELAEHLRQFTQRDVVGRLQALRRRGMVTYARSDESPSAAGVWIVSEQGRQVTAEITEHDRSESTRHKSADAKGGSWADV